MKNTHEENVEVILKLKFEIYCAYIHIYITIGYVP